MIYLLLDKQIFASSDARFERDMHNDGRNMRNFSYDMRLHGFVFWMGLEEYEDPQGTPPINEKISMSK